MTDPVPGPSRVGYSSFGPLLKYLRRRAHLTQRDLALAVGYSISQISRLEGNQRPPDLPTLAALFIPSLHIENDPETVARFLQLAATARGEPRPDLVTISHVVRPAVTDDLTAIEAIAPASRPGNLPLQLTSFIGREHEIADVRSLLKSARLVTLTGSGGVGKTRLSLQVAEEVLGEFPDGICLVELAPLSEPALVPQQVGSSLGLRDEPGRPILDTLAVYLRARQALLVLDNCEHLLEACAWLADRLLRNCSRLSILASSREALGVAGEVVFRVLSLTFPDPGHLPSIERLNEYLAVRLFVDRTRLVLPNYQVTQRNAAAVARICQRLDGIPLAIEMAAARISILTAKQLANRLDDAFGVLTGGNRTALPKHQTLRATLDWSYNLLNEGERLLLQRLSVFAGDCKLEAAEAVCSGEGLAAGQILNLLASLVAKSMVIADRHQGVEARYRLLEMVRQYARETLEAAGETARLRNRHRDWFLMLAKTMYHKRMAPARERAFWRRKLKAEQENLRLALEWSFTDQTDVETAPRLVLYMLTRWPLTSQEELDWCNRAVAWCRSHAEISGLVYARLVALASSAATRVDLPRGLAGLKQAVEISRRLGPEGKTILMRNLSDLGAILAGQDEIEQARAAYAEAEAIFEASPESFSRQEYFWRQARFADANAILANKQGRYLDTIMHASASIRLDAESGDPQPSYRAMVEMGHAYLALEEYDQARAHYRDALRFVEEMLQYIAVGPDYGDWGLAYIQQCLGRVDLRQGNLDRALKLCQTSVQEAYKIPNFNIIASGLGLAAGIWAQQGQWLRAATMSGASQALYAGTESNQSEDSSLDRLLPEWREWPDHQAVLQAFAAGQAMDAEQAVAFALSEPAVR